MITLLRAWQVARVNFPSIEEPSEVEIPDYGDDDEDDE
jgi:hypothetical protein